MAGAPKGNTNAQKGREWREAIRYALAHVQDKEPGDEPGHIRGLRKVAQKFVEAAENGDAWAMKELGDRWDGKPAQAVEISGKDGGPIEAVEWNILPVVPIDETNSEG